jgi:DNA-binding response OmpR family regulator
MDPTILVVEDDPQLRQVISEVLSDEGFTVHEASDGQRALEEIAADTPDLVLSDISMPRLTGVELAEELSRREDPVPIVLMSAASNAPPTSGTMFLPKPFTIDELLALVARVLRERPHRRYGATIAVRS